MKDKTGPKYKAKLWDDDHSDFNLVYVWKIFSTAGEAIVSDEKKSVRRRVKSASLSSFELMREWMPK